MGRGWGRGGGGIAHDNFFGRAAMPAATGSVRPAGPARAAPVATDMEATEGRVASATKKGNLVLFMF